MRILRWLAGIILALAVAAGLGWLWKGDEIRRLMVVNTLFEPEHITQNFSNMDAAFLHVDLPAGPGPASPLPKGASITLPDSTRAMMEARQVTSFLVLKDGVIRHEDYLRGTGPEDRRISWSIAKSYLSALFGVVLAEGHIDSLDDPVRKYDPRLAGTAYDAATVRDVLNMTSGVRFNEDYFDYHSDINRMGRVLALGREMDAFTLDLTETDRAPGQQWQYVSIDTHVVGMVIRGATGRSASELMAEKILAPLGLEQGGTYLTDGAGVAFVLGGLNFSTRDYARFGQMMLQDGRAGEVQVVPAEWIEQSLQPDAPTQPGQIGYGNQWWFPVDAQPGEAFGHGIYGQYLYLDRERDVLIVSTATDRNFREPGTKTAWVAEFRKIARALAP